VQASPSEWPVHAITAAVVTQLRFASSQRLFGGQTRPSEHVVDPGLRQPASAVSARTTGLATALERPRGRRVASRCRLLVPSSPNTSPSGVGRAQSCLVWPPTTPWATDTRWSSHLATTWSSPPAARSRARARLPARAFRFEEADTRIAGRLMTPLECHQQPRCRERHRLVSATSGPKRGMDQTPCRTWPRCVPQAVYPAGEDEASPGA
jgi:hypothetical protein